MGKINQGILGGISGKVGNVIGGSWKGISYLRVKPSSVANPKTEKQLTQRMRFSLTIGLLKPMTEFLRVGFKLQPNRMSPFNAAMSYNVNSALTGVYPDFLIDYSLVLVSKGSLTGVHSGYAASSTPSQIMVSWVDNSNQGNALPSDKSLIMLLNPSRGEAIYTTSGPLRSLGIANFDLPPQYFGESIEVYLGFISDAGTKVSNSSYLGSVIVT